MKTKKREVKAGQIIYVTRRGIVVSEYKNLSEYEVVKVNTSSVYARSLATGFEIRLDKRTLKKNTGIQYYQGYINSDEYWQELEEERRVNKLRGSISKVITKLSLEELEEIETIVEKHY